MNTIMIDGRDYADPRAFHLALKTLLKLPEYYGCNADALNDCLSERRDPVQLWILDYGTDEVAAAVRRCAHVITDNGGTVKELKL